MNADQATADRVDCPPAVPWLMYTPEEVAEALRVGRSKVYDLMRSGQLRSVKIGGSRRVPATVLASYVAMLAEEAA